MDGLFRGGLGFGLSRNSRNRTVPDAGAFLGCFCFFVFVIKRYCSDGSETSSFGKIMLTETRGNPHEYRGFIYALLFGLNKTGVLFGAKFVRDATLVAYAIGNG